MKFEQVYGTMRNMGIKHSGSSSISKIVLEEVTSISSLLKINTDLVMIRVRQFELDPVKVSSPNLIDDQVKGDDNRNWDQKETTSYSSIKVTVFNHAETPDQYAHKYDITFDFDVMYG